MASTMRDKATVAVRAMIEAGEEICSIPIGESDGKTWISADRNRVTAIDAMEIDGRMHFLGFDLK